MVFFFASIHEANLTNYADMTFIEILKIIFFKCNLVPWPDGERSKLKPYGDTMENN
jgi:hypothetical protein